MAISADLIKKSREKIKTQQDYEKMKQVTAKYVPQSTGNAS